ESRRRGTDLTRLVDQVDVEVDGLADLGAGELRVPVLVEPAAAEGVDDGVERSQYLAPTGLAAQADTRVRDALRLDRLGPVCDLRPLRLVVRGLRNLDAGLFEHVLAVHQERRLAVERYRVHVALI